MNDYKERKECDYQIGLIRENEIEIYLKTYFNQSYINKLNRYDKFDYEGDSQIYEIKSRNCSYSKYPTTMVSYSKILYGKKQSKTPIFIFSFTDGDYYYKYNNNEEFEIRNSGRMDRGRNEISLYYFIPIDKLIKIEK
jgi:hypothetical protein